jgi:hypothetical protein
MVQMTNHTQLDIGDNSSKIIKNGKERNQAVLSSSAYLIQIIILIIYAKDLLKHS